MIGVDMTIMWVVASDGGDVMRRRRSREKKVESSSDVSST